jgi:hypothetical protein
MTQVASAPSTRSVPKVYIQSVGMILTTKDDFAKLVALGVLDGEHSEYVAAVDAARIEHDRCGVDSSLGAVRYEEYLTYCLLHDLDSTDIDVFNVYCNSFVNMYLWRSSAADFLAVAAALAVVDALDEDDQKISALMAAGNKLFDGVHAFVHAEAEGYQWEVTFEFTGADEQSYRCTLPLGPGCLEEEDPFALSALTVGCLARSGSATLRIFADGRGQAGASTSTERIWETRQGVWAPLSAAQAFNRACTTPGGDFTSPPPGVQHLSADNPPDVNYTEGN